MTQFCGSWRGLALTSCALLLLAGCPQGSQLDDINLLPSDDEDVFQVLGETVSATELVDAEFSPDTQTPADETVNFGEAEALFDAVPFEAIDLPEDTVLSEVTPTGGGLVRAHGGLAGRFVNHLPDSHSDHSPGVFRGRWFAANGEVRGVVRGEYRPLPPDDLPPGIVGGGLFHGRYIGNDGQFRGFLRGRYGHRQGGPGFFFGRWLDRHDRLIGLLEGRWEDEPNTNGGTFRGRWAAFNICDEANSLVEPGLEGAEALSAALLEELSAADAELDRLAASIDVELAEETEVPVADELDLVLASGEPCIDPNDPYGFLRGWHRPVPPDDPNQPQPAHGVFHGHWRDADGRPLGRLAGRYAAIDAPSPGQPPPPPGVRGHFRGRYVDRTGQIRGFIRGVYGVSPHGLGVFRGHYFNRAGEPLGILLGRWSNAPNVPGGPFFGFWAGVDFGDPGAAPE